MADHDRSSWKDLLGDAVPDVMAEEIDLFETQMELRKDSKLDEKVFAELRLRRGAYGQRYDNGFRHDGEKSQTIPFPSDLTKGPDTFYQAPGMQRIKLPGGKVSTDQMDVLADLAEEYSDGILHITTRQDIQLHFCDIEDTPDMHRRLAAVEITTREACGNSWRNITACPRAGICRDEAFDVTSYAEKTAWHFMGHRDVQDFGRKFKPAFSGCKQHACGLVNMHDLGLVAQTREENGETVRGFELWVGGGLGAIPHDAKLFDEFIPESEVIPLSQAISRVYARLGEKKNRNKARIKFLVAKLGIDEFRRLVLEERDKLESEAAWTDWLPEARDYAEEYPPQPSGDVVDDPGEAFEQWKSTNVYKQRQDGFSAVTIALPLGDITSQQARRLSDVVRRYASPIMRATVEQNLFIRWVHDADLPALFVALDKINLAANGGESIVDVTSCPGTDTCKLGISASRGLAGELGPLLAERGLQFQDDVKDMRVKVSGCFNSCGQHHVSDIGFYGNSRTVGGYRVPHFQLVLGGEWSNNGASYGMPLGAYPSKGIPSVLDRLLEIYRAERQGTEKFRETMQRLGKKDVKERLKDLTAVPSYEEDKSYYTDWADSREYTIGDIGVGECAGEVVTLTDFSIAEAESEVFDAQVLLDEQQGDADIREAYELALKAMLSAAQGLIKMQDPDIADDADAIIASFKKLFFDTEVFFDPYAKGKFGQYLFTAHEEHTDAPNRDLAKQRIEEAQLFIEAAVACHARLAESAGAA